MRNLVEDNYTYITRDEVVLQKMAKQYHALVWSLLQYMLMNIGS